jgi:CheY-like chemotaxis protein
MEKSQILIVEDEIVVATELEESLKKLGYGICGVASSGQKAIQKGEQENPDLVLMDIKLKGGMDGIQAAEMIRTRLGIPVIFLTAYTDDEIVEEAKVTEPYAYIVKPYRERELHIAIEFALHKHRAEKERKALIEEVKILRGLLPICSSCKKIRDDKGYWQQIEGYIRDHSEAEFTHSICPDCAKKLYPELYNRDRNLI